MKRSSKIKKTKKVDKINKSAKTRTAILITGAGSGIGLAFTENHLRTYSLKNPNNSEPVVVMVARNPQKLKQTANRLRKQYGKTPEILTLALDLSQVGAVKKVMYFVNKNHLQITTLINNAGVGYMGEFQEMAKEKFQEIIALNITALTELTHALLSHILSWPDRPMKNRNPIIIHVASVVGFLPFPLTTVYAASKAYVINFSEALRVECEKGSFRRSKEGGGRPVEIYTLCPGSTRTAFFERAGKQIISTTKQARGLLSSDQFMDPDQVVSETWEAVSRKQSFIIPGKANRLIPLLGRVLPRGLGLSIAHRFMKKRLD